MSVDRHVTPPGFDAMPGGGDEPSRRRRRGLRSGTLLTVCLVAAAATVAAVVLTAVNLAGRVQLAGQWPANRPWITGGTLGPAPSAGSPAGAIPGISLSGVWHDLPDVTGAQLPGSVHAGHNYHTVVSGGRPLTVDVLPFGQPGTYVRSVSCEYHTDGPRSVDSAMVTVIQGCLFALVPDSLLSTTVREDLSGYARTGRGDPRRVGSYETVTVTDDGSTYGVVAAAGQLSAGH